MKKHFPLYWSAIAILILATLACNIPNLAAAPSGEENPVSESPNTESNPSQSTTDSGACSNPLLPIKVGATWTYAITAQVSDTFTRTILSVDSAGFTDQDTFGTGAVRQGKWNCDNGNLIALNPNGRTTASVSVNGASGDFETTSLSGVTLPAIVNNGDTWTQNTTIEGVTQMNDISADTKNEFSMSCTAGGTESVTVPAGTFNAVKVTCDLIMNISITMNGSPLPVTPIQMNSTSWYAPGIGWVKSITPEGEYPNTVELTSYSIP